MSDTLGSLANSRVISRVSALSIVFSLLELAANGHNHDSNLAEKYREKCRSDNEISSLNLTRNRFRYNIAELSSEEVPIPCNKLIVADN